MEKLDLKTYTRFDKTFMFFGSACNASKEWIAKNVKNSKELQSVLDFLLVWAKVQSSNFVSEVYGEGEENKRSRKIELAEESVEFRDLDTSDNSAEEVK